MTPLDVALAMVVAASTPWVTPTERDGMVMDLLYDKSIVTATIDWQVHGPLIRGHQKMTDPDGNVWKQPTDPELRGVVKWIFVGNIRDIHQELDAKFFEESKRHTERDTNGDGFVDGDDIQGFVNQGAWR